MKRAVLISGHYLGSKRRAGFHWVAHTLAAAGWQVLFITSGISWLSYARRDFRLAYPIRREAGQLVEMGENLRSFVWFTPYHPANLRLSLLNSLSTPLFERYGQLSLGAAENVVAKSNLCIFESTSGLYLVDRFKRLCPSARFVYRVSDDLRLIKAHPSLFALEERLLPKFDLVSVPNQKIADLLSAHTDPVLHSHGLNTELFDQTCDNPYEGSSGPNIVYVGASHIDTDVVSRASRLRPDCRFHIIGPVKHLPKRDNVVAYGELPFEETVPYLKHADLGLHMLSYRPGVESLGDSLKVIQYTYCQLPILAPDFLKGKRQHILHYTPDNDESIKAAMIQGLAFDRTTIDTETIWSWTDLTERLCGKLEL